MSSTPPGDAQLEMSQADMVVRSSRSAVVIVRPPRTRRSAFLGASTPLNSLVLADDDRLLAAADDRTLQVRRLTRSEPVRTIAGHDAWVLDVDSHVIPASVGGRRSPHFLRRLRSLAKTSASLP